MNQILVTEKLYVTPELKRKKKIYKINFMISIIIIVILCSVYIHTEYARSKEQNLSQHILAGMVAEENEIQEEISEEEENVWKIMISSVEQEYTQQGNTITQNTTTAELETTEKVKKTSTYTEPNGKRYQMVGRIKISKIGVDYAILSETSVEWLKVSPCKFWGPEPNEIGNFCIAGHNYRNKRFFSKVPDLVTGDLIEITDLSRKKIKYSVYDKYTVDPEDTSCLDENIPGKRIITLITCTDDSEQRVIVHAQEL